MLPSQMLMYIYTSIIQPKMDYAISVWGYTTAHNITQVQRLQHRAARILTGNVDHVNTRGIDLVNTLGLMNASQRRDYFMIILMFTSIHGLLLLLLNFITDSLLHVCAGKYDSCPKYKHYNKDTTLQTTDIVISYSVLHAMNIKQPPPVGTYS